MGIFVLVRPKGFGGTNTITLVPQPCLNKCELFVRSSSVHFDSLGAQLVHVKKPAKKEATEGTSKFELVSVRVHMAAQLLPPIAQGVFYPQKLQVMGRGRTLL